MKISVGIPVYDGNLSAKLAACLLAETSLAHHKGDLLTVRFLPACTNLALGRNQLVHEFLESDDERLVFLDADVTFEFGELLKIAHHPVELVGGAYRMKKPNEVYPIWLLDHPAEPGPGGLVEVGSIPTGFMSLSRDVFTKFRAGYPGREYRLGANSRYCYFQIPYCDGALYTEDAYFCKEWRAIGGKVYVDPEMSLTHWQGNIPYPGHLGNHYRKIMSLRKEPASA
jgi:hypothetical protein